MLGSQTESFEYHLPGEFLREAQVHVDTLVLYGLTQPIVPDFAVGPEGLSLFAKTGLDDGARFRALVHSVNQGIRADVHDVLNSNREYTRCIKACTNHEQAKAVRLVFEGIVSLWSGIPLPNEDYKDQVIKATDYLLSPHLEKDNSRLVLLCREALQRERYLQEREAAENLEAARIQNVVEYLLVYVFQTLKQHQVLPSTYQVDLLKLHTIKSYFTDLIIKYAPLLGSVSDPEQMAEINNEIMIFATREVQRVLNLPDQGDSGGGLPVPEMSLDE